MSTIEDFLLYGRAEWRRAGRCTPGVDGKADTRRVSGMTWRAGSRTAEAASRGDLRGRCKVGKAAIQDAHRGTSTILSRSRPGLVVRRRRRETSYAGQNGSQRHIRVSIKNQRGELKRKLGSPA